jgi:hypothetical protein
MKQAIAVMMVVASVNAHAGKTEAQLWPINEKTHEIPVHKDARTGFVDANAQTIIGLANEKYTSDERLQIIDYCRHDAIKRIAGGNLAKYKTAGMMEQLSEEFQHCAVGMIKQWFADDAAAETGGE